MKRFAALLVIMLAGSVHLFCQRSDWRLDKAHSRIAFSVHHMVISEVSGSFEDFDIALRSSRDDFTDAAVEGTIRVNSINTDNERRDNHLKSDDFFNAERYPQIKFKSTSFDKVGDNRYKIIGDLSIRDSTKSVVFDATYNGSVELPNGSTMVSWSATTSINRFDYGLKWSKALETGRLIAGENVKITMNLEFNR